jgi:hypothetical protein
MVKTPFALAIGEIPYIFSECSSAPIPSLSGFWWLYMAPGVHFVVKHAGDDDGILLYDVVDAVLLNPITATPRMDLFPLPA